MTESSPRGAYLPKRFTSQVHTASKDWFSAKMETKLCHYVKKGFSQQNFLVGASRDKLVLSSFSLSHEVQKRVKTVQTNMVAYIICVINFQSDVRSDLRGCLEAIVASKLHFLSQSTIDGSSFNFKFQFHQIPWSISSICFSLTISLSQN